MPKLTNINTDLTGRILHPTDVNYDSKRYLYTVSIPSGKYAVAYYDINEVTKIGKPLSFIVKAPGGNKTSTTSAAIPSFGLEPLIKSISDRGIKRADERSNVITNANYIEFTTEYFRLGNNAFGSEYDCGFSNFGIAYIKTSNGADTQTISSMRSNINDDFIKSRGIKYTGMSFNRGSIVGDEINIISQIPLKIHIIDSIDML